ncbi:MAG: alpha/beta fold hydrolase [Patescibacteria group bacterium]
MDRIKHKRKLLKILIEVTIVVGAWFFLVSFFAYYNVTHPRQTDYSLTPDSYSARYEDVYFQTDDDLRLAGWFMPASQEAMGTVVVMHGYPANKADVLNWSLFLREKFNILLFDFRYFGSSEGKYTTVGWDEKKDLKAAIDYLVMRKDVNPEKIGVMGFSMGGAVGIMHGSDDPRIKAIVADSAYASLDLMVENMFQKFGILKKPMIWSLGQWSTWRVGVKPQNVSTVQAASRSTIPLLLIHGTADQEIPLDHSEQIFQATKGASELWEIDNAGHGEAYFNEKTLYEAKVNSFFEANFASNKE